MIKGMRAMSAGLFVALLAGLVPGTAPLEPRTAAYLRAPLTIPSLLHERVQQAIESGDPFVEMEFTVGSTADQARLEQAIRDAGGEVTAAERSAVRAKVPVAAAERLPQQVPVVAVGVNKELPIEPSQVPPPPTKIEPDMARDMTAANFEPIDMPAFQQQTGSQGRGITVAVIDSGVDVGHPALATTSDGRPKIVDWKDFTREGYVTTDQAVPWSASFTAPDGRTFGLPDRPPGSGGAQFGYLDENNVRGYINQDLDRNGEKTDRFGVLLVDRTTAGRYDTVYVDTNNDGDFRDETPLSVYSTGHQYGSIGQNRTGPFAPLRLNFVVASMDPGGKAVRIGFDGYGHGTQVSGVLAAYSPGGYTGVAPGAQIMALKAIKSTGSGEWFQIKEAILYAATHGAQVINLSVGGLASGAAMAFDSGASEWLNQIASDYGVLIVLAADNNGPGLSSGATLGNPSAVMAVGSYYTPEMWKRDYDWVVPHESIWFFSGMGPRSDGSYLPSVVAPGGSTAPSPRWRDNTGYATAVGTSIATPHVSGAAALLMEAARREGIHSDWMSVKRGLELGARSVPGFAAYEQGNGLIQLRAAYGHIQSINSIPALKGRLYNGDGGVLARSYTPGSSAFQLTNLDSDIARVSVFSSDAWIRPTLSSMTLPPQVTRQLPLQFDAPAEPGAHSGFLQITHQNKYGPSLVLPVTFVRPIELGTTGDAGYTTSENLEAGRYRRYFFNVKPGTSALTVTARVPLNQPGLGAGTVQVHVFRPDGQPVHVARVGVAGDGLSSLFQTGEPVQGVWEVVVVALPDTKAENANPGFTLEVKNRPGPFGAQPLKLNVPADGVMTQSVKVTNVFGPFTGSVEAMGLAKNDLNAWNRSLPWHVERTADGTSTVVDSLTLQQFTSELQVEVDNRVPGNGDLLLSVWRVIPTGGLEMRAQSITPGTGHQTVRLSYLPAGTYKVLVSAAGQSNVMFQYRRIVGYDGLNLSVQDAPRKREQGDVWTVDLSVKAPKEPGRYTGHLLVRDTEHHQVLGWFPVEVSVGQPALSIRPMVAQLVDGKPSTAVFEVRDARTGQLVPDPVVTVNGQRYLGRNGQVMATVVPHGSTQVLEVQADMAAYQFVQDRFTLPVKQSWGFYPLGVDSGGENASWRRKLFSQLP